MHCFGGYEVTSNHERELCSLTAAKRAIFISITPLFGYDHTIFSIVFNESKL